MASRCGIRSCVESLTEVQRTDRFDVLLRRQRSEHATQVLVGIERSEVDAEHVATGRLVDDLVVAAHLVDRAQQREFDRRGRVVAQRGQLQASYELALTTAGQRGGEMPVRLVDRATLPDDPVPPERMRVRVVRIDRQRLAVRLRRIDVGTGIARLQEVGPTHVREQVGLANLVRLDAAAGDHGQQRVDDVAEGLALRHAHVAQPGHREVFL